VSGWAGQVVQRLPGLDEQVLEGVGAWQMDCDAVYAYLERGGHLEEFEPDGATSRPGHLRPFEGDASTLRRPTPWNSI